MARKKTKPQPLKEGVHRRLQSSSKPHKAQLDKRMDDFGEEMEALGKKIEHKGKGWESWWDRTFGVAGPFISAVLAMIFFFLMVWFLDAFNAAFQSPLLSDVRAFLLENTGIFFLLFVMFSYSSYFSRKHWRCYRPVAPIVVAAGITAGFWLVMNAMNIANYYIGSSALFDVAIAIERLLPMIFGVSVFLGYIILIVKMSVEARRGLERMTMEKHTKRAADGMKRLYRSSKDKILGGVCGGLGEYFQMDPVIFRLIFVLLAFAWGFGILFYIICWIIVPRNPEHKWGR